MNIWKLAHFVTSMARKDPEYNMPLVHITCYFQTDIEISNLWPSGLTEQSLHTEKPCLTTSVSSNWPNWPSRATIMLTWNELLPHQILSEALHIQHFIWPEGCFYYPILHMRKLRHREVKQLAQGMWLLSGRVDYEPRQPDPELQVWAITLPGLRVLMPRG